MKIIFYKQFHKTLFLICYHNINRYLRKKLLKNSLINSNINQQYINTRNIPN